MSQSARLWLIIIMSMVGALAICLFDGTFSSATVSRDNRQRTNNESTATASDIDMRTTAYELAMKLDRAEQNQSSARDGIGISDAAGEPMNEDGFDAEVLKPPPASGGLSCLGEAFKHGFERCPSAGTCNLGYGIICTEGCDEGEKLMLEIFDESGKIRQTSTGPADGVWVHAKHLPPGIYKIFLTRFGQERGEMISLKCEPGRSYTWTFEGPIYGC